MRVAAGADHAHAGHDRVVVRHEVEHAGRRRAARSSPRDNWRGCARADGWRPPTPPSRATYRARGKRGTRRPGASRARKAAGVIEVQVRREHDIDVVGGQPGLARARDPGCACDRCRRCRRSSASILSPMPASMIMRPLAAHEQRPHAQLMRFSSSAGARFSHSGFGTTPNIAPPSRRKKPSKSGDQFDGCR